MIGKNKNNSVFINDLTQVFADWVSNPRKKWINLKLCTFVKALLLTLNRIYPQWNTPIKEKETQDVLNLCITSKVCCRSFHITKLTFTYSKSTVETQEIGVAYV